MNTEERAGSFTVFFSLLCLPMILLWVSLLQWTRFMVERNDALRMTQEAGQSILSCYCEELTRRYGLYGTEGSGIRVSMGKVHRKESKGILGRDPAKTRFLAAGSKTMDRDICVRGGRNPSFLDSKHCRIWIFLELR